MKKIRIAQIGTNGMTHAAPTFDTVKRLSDTFDLIGLAEPVSEWRFLLDTPRYKSVPHYSVEEILALKPDAVLIETNEECMTEYALRFAEQGIAVHVDKPASPDHDAFCRLARVLQEKSLPLHLGYMYRYNPLICRAFELAERGELGEILSVECHMSCDLSAENRSRLSRFPAGQMYYLGCHMLDLILRLMGEPKSVTPYHRATGRDGVNVTDSAFVTLSYEKGVSFVKTSACEAGGFARRQLVIVGSEGTLELKPLEKLTPEGHKTYGGLTLRKDAKPWEDSAALWESEPFDRYEAMMLHFARAVRGERDPVYTPAYEMRLHKLLLEACGVK